MNEIVLRPKYQPSVGLQVDVIRPESFAGKDLQEIGSMQVFCGNQKSRLDEFFEIYGSMNEEGRIVIDGDVSRTKMIGRGMKSGEIWIKGSVDMYVGAGMKGGRIIVEGNADSFAGQKMEGGELIIKGNAKDYLGASYRGDWRGMKGGKIVVEGNAGSEVGEFMVGGKITIKGDCGAFAGVHMRKGLIVIEGNADRRTGAQMIGGTIVVLSKIDILPGFRLEGKEENPVINGEEFKGKFKKYSGDHAERNAKGTVYVKL
jgi:formylmethanofuran dehydrogenase subunit C